MGEIKTLHHGLVPVYENEDRQVVNARELHEFLESGWRFTDWIKERIEKYGFVEGEDYILVFPEIQKNPQGGRPTKDYLLTLNVAKELCMVENNERGRQARKYFIACEEELRKRQALGDFYDRIPKTYHEALRALADSEEENVALVAKVQEDAPKVLFAKSKERTINNPDGSVRITKTTKVTGRGQVYFINKFLGTEAMAL